MSTMSTMSDMSCDDAEVLLLEGGEPTAALEMHLRSCAGCQAFRSEAAEVLRLAALPQQSPEERASYATLPAATLAAWQRAQHEPRGVRRLAGYALAAGLGALIASGAWLSNPRERIVERERIVNVPLRVASSEPEVALEWGLDDSAEESSTESFYEVSWPVIAEGENP